MGIRNSSITFYLLMKNNCTLASLTKKDMVIEQRPAWKIIHEYLFAYQCFCCLVWSVWTHILVFLPKSLHFHFKTYQNEPLLLFHCLKIKNIKFFQIPKFYIEETI